MAADGSTRLGVATRSGSPLSDQRDITAESREVIAWAVTARETETAEEGKTTEALLAELAARVEVLEQRSLVAGTLAARLAGLLCRQALLNASDAEKRLFPKIAHSEGAPASQAAGLDLNRLRNEFLGMF